MVKSKTDKGVTLIAVNTAVEGHIRFSGELYINGAVVGDIVAQKGTQGALVISEEGSVKGEIRVPIVIVGGCVEGDLHASQRVELGKKARIRGDLYYKVVEIQHGALMDGRMVPQEETAANVHALPVGTREDDGSDRLNR
jgi:cytoskeletal protein CcmA (bactofilin family)